MHFLKHTLHILFALLFICIASSNAYSTESCSRTATINFQEVLIDSNSTQKGEGLRFHLSKDPVSKKYLDDYQNGLKVRWSNIALGTTGSGLIIYGLMQTSNNKDRKKQLIIGGATLLAINFLVAKTMNYKNEQNLIRSIEEYNKRNLPRIYINSVNSNTQGIKSIFSNLIVGITKEF